MMPNSNSNAIDGMNILRYVLAGLALVSLVFAGQVVFTNLTNPKIINVAIVLPFVFFVTPYLILSLYKVRKVRYKMEVVPRFFRDVVDNIESGTDLYNAIKGTLRNEYGVLNGDVQRLANQLAWGVAFETAFLGFAKNIGDTSLYRDVRLIVEARKVGGHFEKILREVSTKITIEILRSKERRSNLASNTFTGYISFIIFILIIILVYKNLFVTLGSTVMGSNMTGGNVDNSRMNIFLSLLIILSHELAILSGLLFGLMQENDLISGAPHIVALVVTTFLSFFIFV